MFDNPGGMKVMHWHGNDSWIPMDEAEHNVAEHDRERSWLKGARIFRCASCDEQIAIAPENPRQVADADHPHPGV